MILSTEDKIHITAVGCRLFRKFCLQSLESAGFLRFCTPIHGVFKTFYFCHTVKEMQFLSN